MNEVHIKTEFTPEQLQKLRELASTEESRTRAPADYNLARKLEEYCRQITRRSIAA